MENLEAEGNRLIAEFMGWIHHSNELVDKYEMDNLKYHSSWDWLMPVVEKIETLNFGVGINRTNCWITNSANTEEQVRSGKCESKIEAVWLAVTQFIQWHNALQSPQTTLPK